MCLCCFGFYKLCLLRKFGSFDAKRTILQTKRRSLRSKTVAGGENNTGNARDGAIKSLANGGRHNDNASAGQSEAAVSHHAFIPKRFEDLRVNRGIRLRRIPIKLIYHKARFKKQKRRLIRGNREPSATQKLEISANSLRLGVKSVGMKNQYHRKKRTTHVKLPEGHLFVYGFTAPTDIDCHVDTLIGGQSIFAEEGKALEHDDNDAAMKTLQDEAILESESEEMSKYKSRVDLSQIQQQKGQRGFHKVRFKVRLRRSCKVTDEKVTKDGELFKLEKSELLHKGRKYTRKLIVRWYYYKVRKRVKPLGAAETGFKCLSKAGTEAGYKAKIIVSAVGVMLHETVEDKDLRFRSGTIRTDGREQRAVGKEHLTSKGSGEFEIGLYPWGHDDMEEDTWEFEIEITDQKRSIHMFKKSMETWAKESNFGQAECLRVVDSYCEGAGSQNPNVDGNRVWNPGVLVVEEDKSYSSVIAEKLWIAEYRRISEPVKSFTVLVEVVLKSEPVRIWTRSSRFQFLVTEETTLVLIAETNQLSTAIFAEEGKALEHDDNNAAMKTLLDEAILESESEEMSKYKSRVDLSQVQQQRGQRVFHKVRFKVRLRRSSKVTDEKVTKDGELFKLEKSELLHKGRKYTRKHIVRWYYYKVRKRVKPLEAVETGFKCLSKAGTEAGYKAKIIVSAVSVMLPETVEVRRSQV
ncbi:hypothetical protein F2Q68_00024792 [Brassica cretica]|uniref:Uncharacterized protein n=1 Tax=Brassica cretica TaxID=69181 RepID=A0A8S9I6U5_BRACR|nr:hypothetical protein F2Q68_00024792 [Brassica cretica]